MMYRVRQPSKYGNKKYTLDGITFDSKKEAARWAELRILEKAGKIEDLRRQVKFILIPAQYEDSTEVYQRGVNKGKPKKGKLIEHEAAYIADFVYRDKETDRTVVEDVKGCKMSKAYDIFVIKRKLMLERYKIRIREI